MCRGRGRNHQHDEHDSDEYDSDEHDEQLQRLRQERDDLARDHDERGLLAATIKGVRSAFEVIVFGQPPAVPEPFDREVAAEIHAEWAVAQPEFGAEIARIREAFGDLVPAGDLFLALVRRHLDLVLRGVECLTVDEQAAGTAHHSPHDHQDPPGQGPSAAPPRA